MSKIICKIKKDSVFMKQLLKASYTERLKQLQKRILYECHRNKRKITESEIRAICVIIERSL